MEWLSGVQLFHTAVRSLMGIERLPDRVIIAAHKLSNVTEHDVPPDLYEKLRTILFGRNVPRGTLADKSEQIERMRTMTYDELISVAHRILDLYADLLVAPPSPTGGENYSASPVLDPKSRDMYKKILVPVDGSSTSDRGLTEAIHIAKHCGASIRLIHVVNELILEPDFPATINYVGLIDQLRENGEKLLRNREEIVRRQGISCEPRLIENPGTYAANTIIADAKDCGADLIVMGTHGRRGISRLALGSDAEAVLRQASIPILLVRDSGQQEPRQRSQDHLK
jgi:nucleotide-binding universal stress UspA family protein